MPLLSFSDFTPNRFSLVKTNLCPLSLLLWLICAGVGAVHHSLPAFLSRPTFCLVILNKKSVSYDRSSSKMLYEISYIIVMNVTFFKHVFVCQFIQYVGTLWTKFDFYSCPHHFCITFANCASLKPHHQIPSPYMHMRPIGSYVYAYFESCSETAECVN